ncbi:hypothetical protein V8E51_009233 [Hyaloscypha variabilis]
MNTFFAVDLNNEAIQLERAGKFPEAEAKYLEALRMKLGDPNPNYTSIGVTQNALGELYLLMAELEKAEEMLQAAACSRSGLNDFDAACTRDNLGRLWEMKGDFSKSRELRAEYPDKMICSYFDCPKSNVNQFSNHNELKKCARCFCVFYCNQQCQKKDWKRHKAFCRAAE